MAIPLDDKRKVEQQKKKAEQELQSDPNDVYWRSMSCCNLVNDFFVTLVPRRLYVTCVYVYNPPI